ncbi:MAG: TetR/AcrR family transcriptional regulator [Burkholderiales bacterium]
MRPARHHRKSASTDTRAPKQERSRATVEAILEAAIQVLEEEGLDGFKVAAIAERSGYGVGTLYQYFSGIDEVMRALVESRLDKQRQTLVAQVGRLAADGRRHDTRAVIRLWLDAMGKRRGAQKALLEWALARPDVRSMDGRNAFLAQILASVSADAQGLAFERLLTPTEMFVLSRAFLGAVRNALWSEEQDLDAPQFVQALADLVDGFMRQLAAREVRPRHAGGTDAPARAPPGHALRRARA